MANSEGSVIVRFNFLQKGRLWELTCQVNELADLNAIWAAQDLGNRAGAPTADELERDKRVRQDLCWRKGQCHGQGNELTVSAAAGVGDVH